MSKKRELKYILSSTDSYAWVDTQYEWEKVLTHKLDLKTIYNKKWILWVYHQIVYRLKSREIFNFFLPQMKLSLMYEMVAQKKKSCIYTKNVIPIIVDFWFEDEEDLVGFYDTYKHCPLVLITSAEVYDFLKSKNCPLNIGHWALSLPDSQILNENYTKKTWDLVLLGRTNPYFVRMLETYCTKYPEFEYVLGNADINNRNFVTNKGRDAGHAIGREAYLEMVRSTKIAFYSTPGIDEAKTCTNFFNQVTPRFLELLAGGAFVMAHYPQNADTEYYEMDTMCNDVDSYEEFEKQLNEYRLRTDLPIEKNKAYLSKHYTSARISDLIKILNENNISVVEKNNK